MRETSRSEARITAAISFRPSELPQITFEASPFDPDEYIRLALHFYDVLIQAQTPDAPRRWRDIGSAVYAPLEAIEPLRSTDGRLLISDRIWLHLFDKGNGERALVSSNLESLPEEILEKALFSFVSSIAARFDDEDRLLLRDALLNLEEGHDWDDTLRGQRAHDVPNHAFFSALLERREEASGA